MKHGSFHYKEKENWRKRLSFDKVITKGNVTLLELKDNLGKCIGRLQAVEEGSKICLNLDWNEGEGQKVSQTYQ